MIDFPTVVSELRLRSSSLQDFITDAEIILEPFTSPGVSPPGMFFNLIIDVWCTHSCYRCTANARVHTGFLNSWNAVADDVISTVKSQLSSHSKYALVSSGHRYTTEIFERNTHWTVWYTIKPRRSTFLSCGDLIEAEFPKQASTGLVLKANFHHLLW